MTPFINYCITLYDTLCSLKSTEKPLKCFGLYTVTLQIMEKASVALSREKGNTVFKKEQEDCFFGLVGFSLGLYT